MWLMAIVLCSAKQHWVSGDFSFETQSQGLPAKVSEQRACYSLNANTLCAFSLSRWRRSGGILSFILPLGRHVHRVKRRPTGVLRGSPALRTKVWGPLFPERISPALSRPRVRCSHWQEENIGPQRLAPPATPAPGAGQVGWGRKDPRAAERRWRFGAPRRAVASSSRGWGRGWRGRSPAPDLLPGLAFALAGAWLGLRAAS